MVKAVKDFYSENAEKQARQYQTDKLAEEFIEIRWNFSERIDNGSVLDAGCGTGRDTEFFQSEGFVSFGIDIASGMIEYAGKNSEGTFQQMDFRDLKFEEDKFDGIWCSASIFFVPKDEMKKVLKEFKRVLKDGGILFVDFKSGDGEYVKKKWNSSVKEWHLNEKEAKEIVRSSGFNIVKKK